MPDSRCCFGVCGCTVKIGTWIIAIVEIVFGALNAINNLYELTKFVKHGVYDSAFVQCAITVAISIIWLVLIVFLIIGLVKNRAGYVLPHWIFSVVMVVWLVIATILVAIAKMGLWNVVIYVVIVILLVYFLYVEYCCYLWMKGSIA